MGRVPVLRPLTTPQPAPAPAREEELDWVKIAAGSTLIASGLLLLTGQRKAAVVEAASGTALAMLDQQDTLRALWKQVPGYVDQIQEMIGKVQGAVSDIAAKRESLRVALGKAAAAAEKQTAPADTAVQSPS